MSMIDNILQRFGFISEKEFTNRVTEAVKLELDKALPAWLGETAEAEKWDIPDPSIFANQADMYRLSPVLGTAISILGNDIGTSKINVKRMVGEELRDIPNHELEVRLRNPNPADSGLEFMQYTTSTYLLNGNAVWWLNRKDADSTVDEIWTIPFSKISPVPDGRQYVSHYDYFPGAGKEKMRLETWEIVHFKMFNPNNRFVGLSPLESLAVTLQGDLSMRRTNTVNYTEYGGAPQSILAFKDYVAEPAWTSIKEEKRLAAKRNEMMMLRGVGDGVSWLQRALSNKDMEYIAGLKQNMTDIFNRMCPGLLSMLSDSATEANALAARATYAEKTLYPLMEVFAQKITTDILPAYGRKLVAMFDDPRVVDRKLQLEEMQEYAKYHTIEEVREKYYQAEPLGDERDKLLLSQIRAQAAEPKEQENPTNMPQEATPSQDGAVDAMKADLMRWKRVALRKFGKEQPKFYSDHIPDRLNREIAAKLNACKSPAEVADLFENVKPQQETDSIVRLARAIENAVK